MAKRKASQDAQSSQSPSHRHDNGLWSADAVSMIDGEVPSIKSGSGDPTRSLPSYLAKLSPRQLEAATHPPEHSLQILAGPGSGKTRVLTSRVAWLILDLNNRLRPEDVVVVTFTNKAANEMKQRLNSLIGKDRTASLVIGTFHATCAKYLRKYGHLIDLANNFTIMDVDDCKKVLKGIIKELEPDLHSQGFSTLKPEQAMSEISRAKAKDLDPAAYRQWLNDLSKAKASSKQKTNMLRSNEESVEFRLAIAGIYEKYQETLKEANALDFDDLLVYGVRLFRKKPNTVANIKHVLVDEFQDTNTAQYMLMSLIAASCRSISVVGDPDQSIYGWRSAEIGNLKKMSAEFEHTAQIRLEENYRSTGAILEAALKVVQQDQERVDKDLFTSHPRGPPVVSVLTPSPESEAEYITSEIKRLIAYSGGMLDYNDFAVLLRFNAISRAIEADFQMAKVPHRLVGGHKFFDRMEVKDLLAYLALADNPGFTPAFLRVVNVPKRGIGEKSIADLVAKAKELNLKPMALAQDIVGGRRNVPGIKPTLKKGLIGLVAAVEKVREMNKAGQTVGQMIEALIEATGYEAHLRRENDFDSRWENVKELINFATLASLAQGDGVALYGQEGQDGEFVDPDVYEADSLPASSATTITPTTTSQTRGSQPNLKREQAVVIDLSLSDNEKGQKGSPANKKARISRKKFASALLDRDSSGPSEKTKAKVEKTEPSLEAIVVDDSDLDADDGDEDTGNAAGEAEGEKTKLRLFLEASILATDVAEEEDEKGQRKPKVTISTCHAAKGLEWPVVFIPAVEEGAYPSYRSIQPHEVDEERRLLYVAMTRAEAVLYLTRTYERMSRGETQEKTPSRFIASITRREEGGSAPSAKAVDFCTQRPVIGEAEREAMATVCGRAKVDEKTVAQKISKFEASRDGAAVRRGGTLVGGGGHSSRGGGGGGGWGWGGGGGGGSAMARLIGQPQPQPGWTRASSLGPFSNANLQARQSLGFGPPKLGAFSSVLDDSELPGRGRVKQPLVPPSMQAQAKLAPPPAPRFTDEVRLQARAEDAVQVAAGRSDGMAPRPRADLQSFQAAHSSSLLNMLDLLGESSGSAPPTASSSERGGGGGRGRGRGWGGKRLGMGPARRVPRGRGK